MEKEKLILYIGYALGIIVFILGQFTLRETRWGYESVTMLFGVGIMAFTLIEYRLRRLEK